MKNINITFPHYLGDAFEKLNGIRVGDFRIKAERLSKPPEGVGGAGMTLGITISAGFVSLVMSGFLQELGKDTYKWFKKQLFEGKEDLEKTNVDKFLVIIYIHPYLVADFDLTKLSRNDFYTALDDINHALLRTKFQKDAQGIAYFEFKTKKKEWILGNIGDL